MKRPDSWGTFRPSIAPAAELIPLESVPFKAVEMFGIRRLLDCGLAATAAAFKSSIISREIIELILILQTIGMKLLMRVEKGRSVAGIDEWECGESARNDRSQVVIQLVLSSHGDLTSQN
jgi:hypothetical protein